jgi:hypothetical protein
VAPKSGGGTREELIAMLTGCDAIIIDPPFGGVLEALGRSVRWMWARCLFQRGGGGGREGGGRGGGGGQFPHAIAFPVFALLEALPYV